MTHFPAAVKWRPAKGWLLVQRIETEEQLGSLVIPDSARQRMAGWCYDVLASGGPLDLDEDAEPRTPHDFQPGDWILTPPRRAMDCDEEGLLLLPEDQVWAVIV